MIDMNTYLHFGIAFVMSLILSFAFSVKWASFIMLTAIITWELCQAQTLINNNNNLDGNAIAWDVFCGITGTFIGCIISTWIQNSIQ